ncbi:MAG: PASTA domain-containing protein [Lachnospiraceae bacterium]|nr:PASTA domain-containing protein [Lachnospiraceae bacterium]
MICKICGKEHEEKSCPHCGMTEGVENDPHYLPVGTELADGKYTVGETVGAGGFGVTYAAWDHVLDKKVAIKEFMPGEFSTRMPGTKAITIYGGEKSEQFQAGMNKFLDESRRLAMFSEVEGIVQIYDYFKENKTAYIVMEFLDGETLADRLKREKKLPFDEAMNIMIPVLDALEVVHKEGMIHRDVAPNNIMLTADGKVKLLDFGAARLATGSYSKSLSVMFKDGFTPEEQYRSRGKQGPWTDVYAAAATLYKMLTGVVPEGALERKVKDELKLPSKRGAKIPSRVDTAIMNALNVNAEKRTQSATEFKEELCGEGNVKKHYERPEEKKAGKVPTKVWVLGGVGILAAAVLLIVFLNTDLIGATLNGIGNLFFEKSWVPNVVGKEMEEAEASLKEYQLNPIMEEIPYRLSERDSAGIVVWQSVGDGSWVESGTDVTVSYNGLPREGLLDQQKMDSYVGKKIDEAAAELEDLQFVVERIEKESTEQPEQILSYDPPEDGYVQGNTIKLYYSCGIRNPEEQGDYEIPDFTEEELDFLECKEELAKKYGVYLKKRKDVYREGIAEGIIVAQSREAGETITKGASGEARVIEVDVSGDKLTKMPDIVGKSYEEAVALLEQEDLGMEGFIAEKTTDESDQGKILSLGGGVKAGDTIERGTDPEVHYGLRSFEVQNLIGRTEAEAVELCGKSGVRVHPNKVRGGNHTVKAQRVGNRHIKEHELISEEETLTIDIGIPEAEYDSEYRETYMASLNAKLRAAGMHEVVYGGAGFVGLSIPWDGYVQLSAEQMAQKSFQWIYDHEKIEWPNQWANVPGAYTLVVGVELRFDNARGVSVKYNNQDFNVPGYEDSFQGGDQ